MAGRSKYTDADRAKVNTALTIHEGNVKRVSRETSVPEATVRLWKKRWEQAGVPAEIQARTNEAVEEFVTNAAEVRDMAITTIRDSLPHIQVKNTADLKNLATVAGIFDDKIVRVSNKPAQVQQNTLIIAAPEKVQQMFGEYITGMLSASQQRDYDIEVSAEEQPHAGFLNDGF